MTENGSVKDSMSAIRLALLGKRARQEGLHHLAEPLAIVGMSCRVSGGADSPEDFWKLICDGTITAREVPAGRWELDEWYDPDPSTPGRTSVKSGSFLDDIDRFDAAFFGIPPREAERMDPHQRLALEVAWEALEDAGIPLEEVRGKPVGVFAASYNNDFLLHHYLRPDTINERTITGVVHAVVANRISHFLGVHGPSLTVDTACSSSLVALHLATRALREGSCDLALVGGVSLMLRAEPFISLSKAGFMSPDGRCKTFDARADGFGRGEGCGFVVLKRLADALEEKDRVIAVVRGSAVNQDGPSTILAAPNGRAQMEVVRAALRDARVEPSAVGYVEAHGTGTRLGDPIEVESLGEALGPVARGKARWLASAKANIGHLEAAAGILGVIRAALTLRHAWLPPHAGFETANPLLDLEGNGFQIPVQGRPWESSTPRTAGVSSFGVGGTNAHVILEEAPSVPAAEPITTPGPWPLLISADTAAALDALAIRHAEVLERADGSHPSGSAGGAERDDAERLRRHCAATAADRSRLERRMAVVASSPEEAAAALRRAVSDPSERGARVSRGEVDTGSESRVTFVFSGQGSQWQGMGVALASEEPTVRATFEEIDEIFEPLAGWSVRAALEGEDAPWTLEDTAFAQPAIFAVQVAVARLLASWGVRPAAVVGHSVGEIAAGHVAGFLDLETAVTMVHHRGRLMQEADSRGAMLATRLSPSEAEQVLDEAGGSIQLAAVNGPRSVVFAGAADAVDALQGRLEGRGVRVKRLPVRYGFHSAMMAPIASRVKAAVGEGGTPDAGALPSSCDLYSTITGESVVSGGFTAEHLARGVDGPVLFEPAVSLALKRGATTFLEIGPRPVLTADLLAIAESADRPPGRAVPVLPTLLQDRAGRAEMVAAVGGLFCAGVEADWSRVLGTAPAGVALPSYPWQHQRFWLDTPERGAAGRTAARASAGDDVSPLLGRRLDSPAISDPVFETVLHAAHPLVEDHRIRDTVLVPAAMMLEMSRQAGEQTLGGPVAISDAVFLQKIVLGDAPHTLHLVVREHGGVGVDAPRSVQLHACDPSGRWTLAFEARLTRGSDGAGTGAPGTEPVKNPAKSAVKSNELGIADIRARLPDQVDVDGLYRGAAEGGAQFGPRYRRLTRLQIGDGEALGDLDGETVRPSAGYPPSLHSGLEPSLLDAALHPTLALLGPDAPIHLPSSVGTFSRMGTGEVTHSHVREVEAPEGARAFDVRLLDASGMPLARISRLLMRPAPADFTVLQHPEAALHRVGWSEVELSGSPTAALTRCRILADRGGFAERLAGRLTAEGIETRVVSGPLELEGSESDDEASGTAWILCAGLDRENEEGSGWDRPGNRAGQDRPDREPSSRHPLAADLVARAVELAHPVLELTRRLGERPVPILLLSRGAHAPEAVEGARAPESAGLSGLARTVRRERPELAATALDLSTTPAEDELDVVVALLRHGTDEPVLALRAGRLLAPRLQAPEADERVGTTDRTRIVEFAEPGDLASVRVVEAPRAQPVGDQVEVRVLRAALNFRDVLAGLGMVDARTDRALGHECAGIVTRVGPEVTDVEPGDRVLALAEGGFGDHVVCAQRRVFSFPGGSFPGGPFPGGSEGAGGIGWDAAVTLPIAALTAHHALITLGGEEGGLRAGQRILVHSGAGGVGQAAVQLALKLGAEVWATAGTPEKRAFLESMGVTGAFDSRSLSFRDDLLKATGGEGVDMVLNSLSGEAVDAGLALLPRGGAFVELGKRDLRDASLVALEWPGVRYHSFDLFEEIDADPESQHRSWDEIRASLEGGELSPLPMQIFPRSRIEEAFRFMSRGEHIGKIVLNVSDRRDPVAIRSGGSYLVTGGTGGVGLATARWLVDRGAGRVILSSRTAPSGAAAEAIEELKSTGADVRWIGADLRDAEAVRTLVHQSGDDELPLRGVMHAAAVLDDALLVDLDDARFAEPVHAKVQGAIHLARHLDPDALDFLLLCSAAGSLLEPAGQGNYAAANATLEALGRQLTAEGWPATTLGWGLWDRGMAAGGGDRWLKMGLGSIDGETAPALLDAVLASGEPALLPILLDRRRFLREAGHLDPLFGGLRKEEDAETANRPGAVAEEIRALPPHRRDSALRRHLAGRLARVLGVDRDQLALERPFRDQGMDSLMAVEIRNTLTRDMGIPLSSTIAFDHPDLPALAQHLADVLFGGRREGTDPTSSPDASKGALTTEDQSEAGPGDEGSVEAAEGIDPAIASLSDEEAERMLLEELGGFMDTEGRG